MSLLDILRQEYVKGRVVDKYKLRSGNVGLIVEDRNSHKRYHVEFKDNYKGPSIDNLFGLFKERFSGKTDQVDKLINKGDNVELTVSYSRGPLREAYYIHSVYGSALNRPQKIYSLPYKAAQMSRY